MGFEDLNKEKPSPDLQRLKDSFDSLISDLRSVVPEISEKRKTLRDEQSAEIDRIYAAQRNLDFEKESVDPNPIAHVEKLTEAKSNKGMKDRIILPEVDSDKKMEILSLLNRTLSLKTQAEKFLDEAKTKESKEGIAAREEFLKEIEVEIKVLENELKAHTGARNAKFLDNIVKDMDSRERGE